MRLSLVLLCISMIVWIFPAIRQYRGNFFYYFLILAVTDPVGQLWYFFTGPSSFTYVYCINSLLLYYSIDLKNQSILGNWVSKLTSLLIIVIALLLNTNYHLIIIVLHIIILFKFIKLISVKLFNENELNLFYLVLILYELTIIVKMSIIIIHTEIGSIFFQITLAFEMLIAVFFMIFREDNSKIIINLKSA